MRGLSIHQQELHTTAFFTGHRILSGQERVLLPGLIRAQLQAAYDAGYRRFFNGCALGFDTLAAQEVIRFRLTYPSVSLYLAVPCADQAHRWTDADRRVYGRLLSEADETFVLSPRYYRGCMLVRNRFMADRSSLCICFLRSFRGGTASAVRYAVSLGMPVVNLAVAGQETKPVLKEIPWNYISISRSAGKNAATAPLRLSPVRKLTQKHMSV